MRDRSPTRASEAVVFISPFKLAPLILVLFAGLASSAAWGQEEAAKKAAPPEQRVGRLIHIPMPISDRVDNRIRRVVDNFINDSKRRGEWPVFIFEIEPGRANFGQALDLARFLSSPALNGATTVAWIPKTITGHAVLVAMACDEIVMSPEAEIGKAGEFETVIEPSVRSAYVEIASRRMSIPSDVAPGDARSRGRALAD